jgi:Prokaryotic E2 family E/Multiubiquitin
MSVDHEDPIVDLEEHFMENRKVPKAKKYRIRLDNEKYVVDVESMTGAQILALASKTPDKYLLRQKTRHGVIEVKPTDVISFVEAGVERFMTIPNEVTEGEGPQLRRQFAPMANDRQYLDSTKLRWESIDDGQVKALVFYDWPLPAGYNVPVANVHVRITPGYPDAQIDMAYFMPSLSRADGRNIGALSVLSFDGQQWQQWSRHRTATSVWRPGIDDLSTHMALVNDWLTVELRK